jgi:glycosyltransferase involved in cell wall biosynthesis
MKTGRGALLASARVAFSLSRIARPFGVLYANSPTAFLISAAAGLVARRPVIWHLREVLGAPQFSAFQLRLLIACANARAARVVASSEATADAFVAAGGRRALVQVIADGVDTGRFERVGADVRAEMRRSLEISEQAFVVGSFGDTGRSERRVLAEALALLPDVQALVVDSAQDDHANLPRLIATCDAVVHLSESSVLAAQIAVKVLVSRRPLIVTDVPGVRDLVEDGVTGIVVAPGDSAALAAAIRRLRDDPIRSDELAFAGAADARRRFSRERTNTNITRVVDDVLSHSRQSRA